jgi:hypothetical protein
MAFSIFKLIVSSIILSIYKVIFKGYGGEPMLESHLSKNKIHSSMDKKKNSYMRNFTVALATSVGFAMVFLAFGLNISQSVLQVGAWIIVLIDFIFFLILLKLIFSWIEVGDVVDGVWAGIVLYCWKPIITLPWSNNPLYALKGSILPVIIGLAILFVGYFYRRHK